MRLLAFIVPEEVGNPTIVLEEVVSEPLSAGPAVYSLLAAFIGSVEALPVPVF